MFFTLKKKYWKSLKTWGGSDVWVRGRTTGYWCASNFWEYVEYNVLLLTIESCWEDISAITQLFSWISQEFRGVFCYQSSSSTYPQTLLFYTSCIFHRYSLLVMCLNTFLFRRNQPGTNAKVSDVVKLENSYYRIQPWTAWGYRKAQNKPWIMGI